MTFVSREGCKSQAHMDSDDNEATGDATTKESDPLSEAKLWAWASLIMGIVVLVFAFGAMAWPVIILEFASVLGSMLFLFGKQSQQRIAVVLIGIAAVFELAGGLVAFVLGIWLTVVPGTLGGFGLLLGLYALLFSIPVLGIGGVDFYTVYLVRREVFGSVAAGRSVSEVWIPPMVQLGW